MSGRGPLGRLAEGLGLVASSVGSVVGVRSLTETPSFEVETRIGEVEIRRYGTRVAAETEVQAPGEELARNEGFRLLAGYIFGGNRGGARIAMTAPVVQARSTGASGERIAMTAPVLQVRSGQGYVVRFLLPASMGLAQAPEPNDARVRIVGVPEARMAVLRFSGSTGAEAVAERKAELLRALEGSAFRAEGEVEAWFYDPPWTVPALRRNEVAVGVVPR